MKRGLLFFVLLVSLSAQSQTEIFDEFNAVLSKMDNSSYQNVWGYDWNVDKQRLYVDKTSQEWSGHFAKKLTVSSIHWEMFFGYELKTNTELRTPSDSVLTLTMKFHNEMDFVQTPAAHTEFKRYLVFYIKKSDEASMKKVLTKLKDYSVMLNEIKAISFSELKDIIQKPSKPSFVSFWFSGCGPCYNELSYVKSLYDKYKDKVNFHFITIEPDHKSMLIEFTNPFNKKYKTTATGILLGRFNVVYPPSIYRRLENIDDNLVTLLKGLDTSWNTSNYPASFLITSEKVFPAIEVTSKEEIESLFTKAKL